MFCTCAVRDSRQTAAGSSFELSAKEYTIGLDEVRAARRGGNSNAGSTYLEPHHTHFLLVDDGSEGRYGTEIDFRARLEAELFNSSSDPDVSGAPICSSFSLSFDFSFDFSFGCNLNSNLKLQHKA